MLRMKEKANQKI
jgi:hypothetical protein